MNGLNRDGWIKERSERNNDISTLHTSPSYFAIIEKRRRWPENAFVPMDERPLEKFDSRGSRRGIIPPYFSTLPVFRSPRARNVWSSYKVARFERDSLLKIFTRWNMLEGKPVYPVCRGNAINGSCHRQALDRTCGCGINGD